MKYPRAAMVHKFLFMMLVELAPYTRGTLSFLPISNKIFRLLMDIVRDEHNISLYNEMRSYSLDYQGIIDSVYYYIIDCTNKKMLERSEKKLIELSILYYSKYRNIENNDTIIKKMRLDNGLLRN